MVDATVQGSIKNNDIYKILDYYVGDIITAATCRAGDAHSSGTPEVTFSRCEGSRRFPFFVLGSPLFLVFVFLFGHLNLHYVLIVDAVRCHLKGGAGETMPVQHGDIVLSRDNGFIDASPSSILRQIIWK